MLIEEILRFAKDRELIIYILLGLFALWEIRRFALAWEEMRGAAFGLERESGQVRLNRAAILLVLILALGMVEFVLVNFVVPSVPGALPLATPTIDLLATATITLAPATTGEAPPVGGETTPAPTATAIPGLGCLPDQLLFTYPKDGDQVRGKITLKGTVDFPNLGFYKYEVAYPGDTTWLPLQAGDIPRHDEDLGVWDTSNRTPGDYRLRLVATDNQGQILGTCEILVHVVPGT